MGHKGQRRIIIRRFDPLHYPSINSADCVFHVCGYLEEDTENRLKALKNCLNTLTALNAKTSNKIVIVLSINGGIEDEASINYLEHIKKSTSIIVFQRPNIGYQWCGLYDVWLKYKHINCNFFATIEQDCYVIRENWFSYLVERIKGKKNMGYIGMSRARVNTISPESYLTLKIPPNIWRDGKNNVVKIKQEQTGHSRGGFYFCTKQLLTAMDNVYGCFSFALGDNHPYDGIVQGEVAFAQKTVALGFQWEMPAGVIGV